MLQLIRLRKELQEANSVVSFETFDGIRVDISKKFMKQDSAGNWHFIKDVYSPLKDKVKTTVTRIVYGEVYVVEDTGRFAADASGVQLISAVDLISFKEINMFRGKPDAEETYRSQQ